MVALHRVLDSRRHPASAGDLMAELECSRSTLFRTIRMLRDHLGAPIANAPGRGWFYDREAGAFELPGLWFRRDELEALLVMDELLSRVQPGLFEDLIAPLRSRFRAILDRGSRRGERFPAHRFRILPAHGRDVVARGFETIATAVVERRRLRSPMKRDRPARRRSAPRRRNGWCTIATTGTSTAGTRTADPCGPSPWTAWRRRKSSTPPPARCRRRT